MKSFRLQDRSLWGFKYAFSGLHYAVRHERHLRFHLCAAIGTTMFTEYFDMTKYDYGFLFLAITLVIASELINTSIENTVDLCTDEYLPNAKTAKDTAAAFVLVSSLFSLCVAAMLFLGQGILFKSLADIFTRPKYIVFFIFTVVFVHGGIFKYE